MCYQIFGQNEKLFGYSDLTVKIYYSAARLNVYTGLKYTESIKKGDFQGIEPDNVLKMIADDYQLDIQYNLDEFSKSLDSERSFIPPGQAVNEFYIDVKQPDDQPKRKFFQVFNADFETPGFIAYHERMQTFLKWYIEAASYLETDDTRFDFFMVFEKLPLNSSNPDSMPSEFQYVFAGYCSTVRFYYHPDMIRSRISQFLILPPYQGHGLGMKLLENICTFYINDKTFDITVESPEPSFQYLRDALDARRCKSLPAFSPDNLRAGFNKTMSEEARKNFRITKTQARRVYEILRLMSIKPSEVLEFKKYVQLMKMRLDGAYQKQLKRIERFRKTMSEAAYSRILAETVVPDEQRQAEIDGHWTEIKEHYDKVISRVLRND